MKEFLSQPISDKYANVDENQNIITINKLMKKPLIASFLNMTFEEVYIRLFVEEQNLFGEEFNGMFKSLHTLSKFLSSLATDIGTNVDYAKGKADTANSVADSSQTNFSNLIGVNLDEELTDMIKYQRSYEASAKLFSTVNNLYDTILSMV